MGVVDPLVVNASQFLKFALQGEGGHDDGAQGSDSNQVEKGTPPHVDSDHLLAVLQGVVDGQETLPRNKHSHPRRDVQEEGPVKKISCFS